LASEDVEVFNLVIGFVAVDVPDFFLSIQLSADRGLDDQPVATCVNGATSVGPRLSLLICAANNKAFASKVNPAFPARALLVVAVS